MVRKSELKIKVNTFIDILPHSSENRTQTRSNTRISGICLSCAAHKRRVDAYLFAHSLYGPVHVFMSLIVFAL